jgi:hypothetical protein
MRKSPFSHGLGFLRYTALLSDADRCQPTGAWAFFLLHMVRLGTFVLSAPQPVLDIQQHRRWLPPAHIAHVAVAQLLVDAHHHSRDDASRDHHDVHNGAMVHGNGRRDAVIVDRHGSA